MGFFDSMKGFLSGVGNLITDVVSSPVGAIFAQAGAQRLFGPVFQPGGAVGFPSQFPVGQFPQFPGPVVGPATPFGVQNFPTVRQPTATLSSRGGFLPGVPGFGFPAPTPFGGQQMPAFVTDRLAAGGVVPAAFDIPGFDLRNPFVAQGAGANTCAPMFRPTVSSISPAPLVMVPNPLTGAPTFFKHAGKPILFSGDLRAAKMVNRLARRARRASPRR